MENYHVHVCEGKRFNYEPYQMGVLADENKVPL